MLVYIMFHKNSTVVVVVVVVSDKVCKLIRKDLGTKRKENNNKPRASLNLHTLFQ